ncbi:globin family protein [Gemmatimonas sp.]
MNLQAERLIRESWGALVPMRTRAAERFYTKLFEIDPTARELFAGRPMHVQQEKFLHTVDMLVQMLDYPPQIIEEFQALAKRHVGYGVLLEHYEPVGNALLWAMAQELGERWTPDVERAWTELYVFIAGIMKRAAAPGNSGTQQNKTGRTD